MMIMFHGLNDFTKKRKKPIYCIISDFSGQIVEEYPTGDQENWKGEFLTYTDEYVLLIKIDSFNNILLKGIFSRIDKKILNDLQQDRVKVCFYLEEGGYQDSVLNEIPYELLQKELLKFNIDESNIVYTDNNLIIEEEFKKHYPDSKIKVLSHNFQIWRYFSNQVKMKSRVGKWERGLNGEILSVVDFLNTKNINREKYFLSYNRSPHPHRCASILNLFESGLHKKGILSFPSETLGVEGNRFSIQEEIDRFYGEDDYKSEEVNDFKSNLPFIADVDSIFLEENRWDSVVIESSFFNTYFSFVVGTRFEEYNEEIPYTIFITEKVYKPLTNFHPLVYLGNMGSLKKLRELGFKTFYPYIDESYDEEPDELKRFNMVMEQVNKLCSMELPELHDLYWSMSDILIHNHDVYYKTVIDKSKSKIEYIVDYIMR